MEKVIALIGVGHQAIGVDKNEKGELILTFRSLENKVEDGKNLLDTGIEKIRPFVSITITNVKGVEILEQALQVMKEGLKLQELEKTPDGD